MREFSTCSINTESAQGEGTYFIHEKDVYIETDNTDITNLFKGLQRKRQHINTLGFTLSDGRISHNGPFMIKSIDKKLTSGQTNIHLIRSS